MLIYIILVSVILLVYTIHLIGIYASPKRVKWYAFISAIIGWYLCFAIVFALPIDIANTIHRDCLQGPSPDECTVPLFSLSYDATVIIWKVLYWSTYVACWLIYPIMQSYSYAPQFTRYERFVAAVKENVYFYGIAGGVMGFFLIYFVATTGGNLGAVAIAAANTWGLLLTVLLLGYGLVEIPRGFWRKANKELRLKHYQYKIGPLSTELHNAEEELMNSLKHVKRYEEAVHRGDAFYPCVQVILKKVPSEYRNVRESAGTADLSYKKLILLHKRLMRAENLYRVKQRSYQRLLKVSFHLQDIIKARKSPSRRIEWTDFKKQKSKLLHVKGFPFFQWLFRVHINDVLIRIFTIFLIILSLITIFCECVFSITDPVLSIFAYLFWENHYDVNIRMCFSFIPLLYISICAYWTIFKLKIFNYYHLIPNQQSDANSILFSSAMLCRLIAPLVYNFLLMIKVEGTAFHAVIGNISTMPFFGSDFLFYFPIILVVLCAASFFNLSTKILACFKIKRFLFSEKFTNAQIDEGKHLLEVELSKYINYNRKNSESNYSSNFPLLNNQDTIVSKKTTYPKFFGVNRDGTNLSREIDFQDL